MDELRKWRGEILKWNERLRDEGLAMSKGRAPHVIVSSALLASTVARERERNADEKIKNRPNRPRWARSDDSLITHIIGAGRFDQLRKRICDKRMPRSRAKSELGRLISGEMFNRVAIAYLYWRRNMPANEIAQRVKKSLTAVESVLFRLTAPVSPVILHIRGGRMGTGIAEYLMASHPAAERLSLADLGRYAKRRECVKRLEEVVELKRRGLELAITGYRLIDAEERRTGRINVTLLNDVRDLEARADSFDSDIATFQRELNGSFEDTE